MNQPTITANVSADVRRRARKRAVDENKSLRELAGEVLTREFAPQRGRDKSK